MNGTEEYAVATMTCGSTEIKVADGKSLKLDDAQGYFAGWGTSDQFGVESLTAKKPLLSSFGTSMSDFADTLLISKAECENGKLNSKWTDESAEKTLYSYWTDIPFWMATFETGDAAIEKPDDEIVWENDGSKSITLPTLSGKTGYIFVGWQVDGDDKVWNAEETYTLDGDKNFVAVWTPVPVMCVSLSETALSICEYDFSYNHETVTLTAKVEPDDAANKNVSWSSSDIRVAEVNENGVVTGKAAGEATITATAKDGSGATASCTVTVYPFHWYWRHSLYDADGKNIEVIENTDGGITPSSVKFLWCEKEWESGPYALYPDGTKLSLSVEDDADGKKKIEISSPKTIYAPVDCEYFFVFGSMFPYSECVKEIVLENLDTSHTTDMSFMFAGNAVLETLYLGSGFDISNVKEHFEFDEECSSLKSINVDEKNASCKSIDGVLFSKDGKTLIKYPCRKEAASYTIPASVTSIVEGAFWGCTSLASIDIPNSVESIGNDAFKGCTSLASIDIPNSVTSIGNFAFDGCSSLAEIVFEGNVPPSFGTGVFDIKSTAKIYVPDDAVGAYKTAKNFTGHADHVKSINERPAN